jgi:gas vesicle protein
MKKIFSFMLGAVTGGVLGAAAALLLTPSSGNEMRRQINSKIQLLQNEVQDARIQKRAELEGQLQALRAPKA